MDLQAQAVVQAQAVAREQKAQAQAVAQEQPEIKLVDVPVTNENVALNLLVAFINHAQRRGVYSIDESAKIWECIKMFQK